MASHLQCSVIRKKAECSGSGILDIIETNIRAYILRVALRIVILHMFPRSTREYVVNSDVIHIEPLSNVALTEPFGSEGSYLQHLRFIQFRVVVSLSPWCVIMHGGSSS